MSDDRFDDGLVHSHGWASEPAARPVAERILIRANDMQDDGLVHSHGWACGERGQMAAGR